MSDGEKITILIPTKNRADFLERLLRYFTAAGFRHWIFIGDASGNEHIEKTKKTLQSLQGKLKVKHFEYPGLSDVGAIERMSPSITTPYSVLLCDDDFLCVGGIERCMDFLDNNPDYGAVHGIGVITGVKTGAHGNIDHVNYYRQSVLLSETGSQRLQEYFAAGPYALVFSIHRTGDWQEMHRDFISLPWARQGFIFGELIVSSLSAIRHKVKELDCLYLVRFSHDRIYAQVSLYDWFTDPDWFSGFKALRERAIAELMRQDGILQVAAAEVFQQSFRPYLARMLARGLPSAGAGRPGRLKDLAHKVPGANALYGQIVTRLRGHEAFNLLPSLLKPSSPYHADFMRVYQAITKNETKNK